WQPPVQGRRGQRARSASLPPLTKETDGDGQASGHGPSADSLSPGDGSRAQVQWLRRGESCRAPRGAGRRAPQQASRGGGPRVVLQWKQCVRASTERDRSPRTTGYGARTTSYRTRTTDERPGE